MNRFLTLIAVCVTLTCITIGALAPSHAAAGKLRGGGIAAGQYTGACQLMIIGDDGTVTYDDKLSICHVQVGDDDVLKAPFPDRKLGRGRWHEMTLKLTAQKPRSVWTAEEGDNLFKVTAIPFSPRAYVMRLEILDDGQLVAGAQQFYSMEPKRNVGG